MFYGAIVSIVIWWIMAIVQYWKAWRGYGYLDADELILGFLILLTVGFAVGSAIEIMLTGEFP